MPRDNSPTHDYDISTIALINDEGTIDLLSQMLELHLYEDLFSPNGVTGTLLLNDAVNLPMRGPIGGDEILHLAIVNHHTPEGKKDTRIDAYFTINSITVQQHVSTNQQVFLLNFVSSWMGLNRVKRIFKRYNDSGANIIKSILDNYLPNVQVAGSEFIFDKGKEGQLINCIIPNWYPHEAIKWITAKILNQFDHADFLFYETLGLVGKDFSSPHFNLRSIEELYRDISSPVLLTVEPAGGAPREGFEDKKPQRPFYATVGWAIDSNFNKLNNVGRGMYGSKMITHDIRTKQLGGLIDEDEPTYRWDYYSEWEDMEHLEKELPTSLKKLNKEMSTDSGPFSYTDFSTYENRIWVESKHTKLYDDEVEANLFPEKLKMNRQSIIQRLQNYQISITILGRFELYVGMLVTLNVPSPEQILHTTVTKPIDELYSGKFLITAIHHKFSLRDHEMTLDLRKDSWKKSYTKVNTKGELRL